MDEVWKDIDGFEGVYQISNLGRVKSLRRYRKSKLGKNVLIEETILNGAVDAYGYKIIGLSKNGKSHRKKIHRLIAEAFIPNSENKPQINHIDGDKLNNSIENLEWCTSSENNLHKARNLGVGKTRDRVKSREPVLMLARNGYIYGRFDSISEASAKTGICSNDILRVCKRNKYKKSAGTCIWRFEKEVITKNGNVVL